MQPPQIAYSIESSAKYQFIRNTYEKNLKEWQGFLILFTSPSTNVDLRGTIMGLKALER